MVGIRVAILTSAFCLLTSAFGRGTWHGIYSDAPIAVHIAPSKKVYQVGDSFRLRITATNTSDRDVLIKKDWKEQLVFYHIHPTTDEQVEWPGQLLIATRMDSSDVVRLEPDQSYTVDRYVRTWISEDVAAFQFRMKLGGIRDYGRKFNMWQGNAWSNAITLTVREDRYPEAVSQPQFGFASLPQPHIKLGLDLGRSAIGNLQSEMPTDGRGYQSADVVIRSGGEVHVGFVAGLGLDLSLDLAQVLPHLPDVDVRQHHWVPTVGLGFNLKRLSAGGRAESTAACRPIAGRVMGRCQAASRIRCPVRRAAWTKSLPRSLGKSVPKSWEKGLPKS